MLLISIFACSDAGVTGQVNKTCYVDADRDGFAADDAEPSNCEGDEAGWVQEKGDCDDEDGAVNPDAAEDCNGVDDNCNDSVDEGVTETYYSDADYDGHGDPEAPVEACYEAAGTVATALDCDDADAAVNPDADEVCNEIDDDCDGAIDEDVTLVFYTDADGDGWGDEAAPVEGCTAPDGAVETAGDCDDGDESSNPDETEICDEADNDCDGEVDEDAFNSGIFYEDRDGDGFGDPDSSIRECSQPAGYVSDDTDCDDLDASSSPDGVEVCDGADNDCDGSVDEEALDLTVWYTDADGDRYGDPATETWACEAPAGAVDDPTDCDDADAAINPAATEVCDAVDNDCDGAVDDDAADVRTWYTDADSDGYGDPASSAVACDAPAGSVDNDDDCDDGTDAAHPGATEVCDAIDNDCDGDVDEAGAEGEATWYTDADGDGWGDSSTAVTVCDAPEGSVDVGGDCNDAESLDHPEADERCDGADNDCDGSVDEGASDSTVWYEDRDGDGHGDATSTTAACDVPEGYVDDDSDCDDLDPDTWPGADEVCDDADNDCDGSIDEDAIDGDSWYADADGDAYGDPASVVQSCDAVADHVSNDDDCDDADPEARPGGTEVCDGADNDCDGAVDEAGAVGASTWYLDADGDGYGDMTYDAEACDAPASYVANADDCDDDDADINPGEVEYCDGVDNDCTGDEDGIVTFTRHSTGSVSDVSSTFAAGTSSSPASITMSGGGDIDVCPGTYYVSVSISSKSTITGVYGQDETTLSGGGSKRVVYSTAELSVTGLTIADGYTTGNGGGLYISGADGDVSDTTIEDGEANRGGNFGFTGGGELVMDNVTLSGGDATLYGGGLWITGSTASLSDVTVDGNQADSGGGLYVYNTTLEGSGLVVSNNSSSTNGGGLHISYNASVTLSGSDIASNSGSDSGGGAYVNDAELTIGDLSNIYSNDASIAGGGVMLDGDADLTCNGTSSGEAGVWGNDSILGGGVYMTGATGSVLDSNSCDWTATDDNSYYDVVIFVTPYSYGNNASFECSGLSCS